MKKADLIVNLPLGGGKNVVIIGGGVTGALSAYQLTQAGHKVTLIEAGDIGNGSSRRSAACIRQQFTTPSSVKGMRFCTKYYDSWQEIVGGSMKPIVHSGYLFLKDWNTNMSELENTVAMQQEAGLKEVKILALTEINEMFPYVDTTGLLGATWCPSDGFLYPDTVFLSAAEASKEAGAKIIRNDAVVSVQFSGTVPQAVVTKSGKVISGDVFINACGPWAPAISEMFGGTTLDVKALKRYLYYIDGYAQNISGQILKDDYLLNLPMVITPHGCYARPESYGSERIMLGWLHHTQVIDSPSFDVQDLIEPGFEIHDINGYGYAMRKEATQFIPDIGLMKPTYSVTSGLYDDSRDHNPLIGYDGRVKNLIHCTGFSGHGLMHAPFSARIVVELVNTECDRNTILLPQVGEVEVDSFHVNREFTHAEGLVI